MTQAVRDSANPRRTVPNSRRRARTTALMTRRATTVSASETSRVLALPWRWASSDASRHSARHLTSDSDLDRFGAVEFNGNLRRGLVLAGAP